MLSSTCADLGQYREETSTVKRNHFLRRCTVNNKDLVICASLLLVLHGCSGMEGMPLPGMGAFEQPKERDLTIVDVNKDFKPLADTDRDYVKKEKIKYLVTGKQNFDTFLKESSIVYAGFAVTNGMFTDVNKELDQLVTEVEGNSSTPDCQKLKNLEKAGGYLTTAGVTLEGGVRNGKHLVNEGADLLTEAKSDFTGVTLPQVTNAIQTNVGRLKVVGSQGITLVNKTLELTGRVTDVVTVNGKACGQP